MLATVGIAQAQTTEVVLHNFKAPPVGAEPLAPLVRDNNGNLYGTTIAGGTANQGVIFTLTPGGAATVLYSFKGGTDGIGPVGALIEDPSGNLYGTTGRGGTANQGTVYKLSPSGHKTILHSFAGADGSLPDAGVIRDSAGNLYGTTAYGGASGWGAVYKIDPSGNETVFYSFTGGADGANPESSLASDSAGNLYGTTYYGGSATGGVVYKLDKTGHETVIYYFGENLYDGSRPQAGVVLDPAGNLYGRTTFGLGGFGGVYKIDPNGNETVLAAIEAPSGSSGVALDSAGNLYLNEGSPGSLSGAIYKLTPTGQLTVLYTFSGKLDGGQPMANPILDSVGNLYGTTLGGGPANLGVVYKLDPSGDETVLYSFVGSTDGAVPIGNLTRDSSGNIYGATAYGGIANVGIAYKLNSTGQETILHSFTGGTDSGYPAGGLVSDSKGNLYGSLSGNAGGISLCCGNGAVYRISASGQLKIMYRFRGKPDAAQPRAGVILDPTGNIYGTTYSGGASNLGAVYKITPGGSETVLMSFGGAYGIEPMAGLVRDAQGNLYGTAADSGDLGAGVVFKLDTAGNVTVLHSFAGGADGASPAAGVTLDASGNLYGTTSLGGPANAGVVYKLAPDGTETVVYSFTGGADGWEPLAGVIRDTAGNLYGTTYLGGSGSGVVYKISPAGDESVLHTFTGGTDGCGPYGGLVSDTAGNLYGTAGGCGQLGGGVVFKLEH